MAQAQTVADLLGGAQAAAPDGIPAPPPGFVPANDQAPAPPPGFVPEQPAQQAPKTIGRGFGLGTRATMEGAAAIPDLPTNALIGAVNLGYKPIGAITKALGGKPEADIPYSPFERAASDIADIAGLPKPQDASERVQQAIAKGAVSAGTGMGAAGALKGLAGVPGAVAGVMSQAPAAQLVGGATGGAAAQLAGEAGAPPIVQFAAGTVAAMLGGYGGGRVAGEIPAPTPSGQIKPQGVLSKALAPFVAAGSQKAAETQAGQQLAARASDPQAVAQALEQPGEIVPGSQPTTFQQTGDMGLGALERETATRDPAAFQQRAAEQNSARRAALGNVETAGDPNDVAKALKAQFDELDAQTQAHVDKLSEDAQAKASAALGPEETPDTTGANVREAISTAEDAARQREGGLWKAVDPEGDLTGNTQGTSQAATDIRGKMAPTAKPMAGEEGAIFDAAESLPPLAPVSDLIALRSRVSTEMRNELIANGRSPAYGRLSALRGAIQDNLAHTIAQEVVNEARATKAGILDPSDTVASRVQSWADDWHAARQAGTPDSAGVPQGSAAGSPGAAGVLRAESPAPEGSGSPGSAEGLPATAPTFDAEAGQRLAAATAATKERAGTFGSQPVSSVLQTTGAKDAFRLPDGSVAAKFFHPGMAAFEHMTALLKAAGNAVLPVIERYAATTLRRAALKADGTLDPAKFATWQKAFKDALRALPPETRAKYASAAKASETLADAQAERAASLKAAQQGAIGKVMGLSSAEDVTRTVGQILNGRTAVADMKALAKATSGNPEARQGLRRAITDHIAAKFVSNTEAGTSEEGLIKADAYQTFIRNNRAALHLVFSPEEVRTMEAVAEDIQRAKRSQNAVKLPGQSNTPQDTNAVLQRIANGAGKSWLHILGGALGATHGPFGAAAGVLTAHLAQALRARGIARVDQLVSEAMLNPSLARELLKKAPRKSANWNAGSGPLTAALWSASSTEQKDARQ